MLQNDIPCKQKVAKNAKAILLKSLESLKCDIFVLFQGMADFFIVKK